MPVSGATNRRALPSSLSLRQRGLADWRSWSSSCSPCASEKPRNGGQRHDPSLSFEICTCLGTEPLPMRQRLPEKPLAGDALADLTWAALYAGKIRDNLKGLTPVFRKTRTRTELTENAALLRLQLQGANRTSAMLRIMSGLEPRPSSRR